MGAPRFQTRERRPWRRRMLATLLGAAALAWALGFVIYATALPDAVADPDRPTDAIVVLTGGSQRLETGLELLGRGKATQLFVSGVYRGVDVAELLRIAQQEPGRHECCIHIDYKAGDTIGNARETAAWMEGRGFVSLRLVTAAYHMPRSLMEFRAAMPETVIVPHPVFPPNVKQDAWFSNPGTAGLFASEYTKYLLARLRLALEALVGAAADASAQEEPA